MPKNNLRLRKSPLFWRDAFAELLAEDIMGIIREKCDAEYQGCAPRSMDYTASLSKGLASYFQGKLLERVGNIEDTFNVEIAGLKAENAGLKAENARLTRRVEALEAENATLHTEIANLRVEFANLRTDLDNVLRRIPA